MKFKKLRFLYITIVSKNYTGRDGQSIMPSQVYSHRDFSECLKLEFNNQVQEEYYAGGATVSLEGFAVKFFPTGDDTIQQWNFIPILVMASCKIHQLFTIIWLR